MTEPRSLPELVALRGAGNLAGEEFTTGLRFADLAAPSRVPPWLAFLHQSDPWQVPCPAGVAVFAPLTLVIGARAAARALALHENDRMAVVGDLGSPAVRLAGVAAALYAGAVLVDAEDGPTVTVTQTTVTLDGEEQSLVGWCETNGLGAVSPSPRELGQLFERMEADVRDGELVVRGPLVMAGYLDDAKATAAAFDGGWFHTGQAATAVEGGRIMLG